MNLSKITIEPDRSSTNPAERIRAAIAAAALPTISWDGEPDRRRGRGVNRVWNQAELVAVLIAAYAHIGALEAQVETLDTEARQRAA